MSDKNIFEQASRKKLRFATSQGLLSVDDLWDLPLTSKGRANLDDIARSYSRELKAQAEESFVNKPAAKDKTLELGFEIVKYIIDTLLAERAATKEAEEKRVKRQKIIDLIARKEEEALGATDLEDLRKQLEAL